MSCDRRRHEPRASLRPGETDSRASFGGLASVSANTAMIAEHGQLTEHKILAVDNDQRDLMSLSYVLERGGFNNLRTTTDPYRALELFVAEPPDLVVLDLHMPRMDGFELMDRLGPLTEHGTDVPILVLSADTSEAARRRALSAGARDILTKPFDRTELLLRVRNLLQVRQLQARLYQRTITLEQEVAERSSDLEGAYIEILNRLALAAEYRDDDTQEHAWRIGRSAGLLAAKLGLPDEEVELLSRAAPLHDIGKIGIPDAILLKPEKLSDAELEHSRAHTTIGAGILSGSRSPLLRLAEQIALTHHERWDGRGYPQGLSGERIPVASRIVAIADVFDALTHDRPYKPAWSVSCAVQEIVSQSGKQFEPRVVDAFKELEHEALLESVDAGERATSAPLSVRAGRDWLAGQPGDPH
jgi:response regulator RpfG family c-di-GMP phosphodiesterase